ncbi:hypothetical protein [Providencia rettgeri]|uniref:hypothetical protein n=1 Tax=Providencia rettgeri TaxID=587 RepID=UPI0025746072|nr:hypothetical protein [Providencia rettgeri]MDL9989464.1 hypothetical protein [Providencia rettgeri]
MATLIDTLLVSLKLDNDGFVNDAKKATTENDKLSASIDALNDTLGNVNKTLKGSTDEKKKAKEQTDNFTKSVNNATKALVGLFTAIFVSTGLTKLIDETAKTNDQLNFLSKNLGMNAAEVKRWQGAAEMSGGSADGMAASLSGLSKSLWDMVTMGDTSVLPYFNALNVGVIKSNGELRNLDDILLDVSDSLSKMSRPQAYNFAKNMGFDDGTINMLLQGRREVEEYLALQKDIVVSSEQELEISRQLNKQNALVSRQWEGLKTLLANYLMPYALKFSETISGFLNYLNRNRDTAVFVFKAIGTVIGVTLIPLALKAGAAFMGMFAPLFGGVGLLLLLGGAIAALYDDYDKWKKGEKSLFDWSEWDASITFVLEKLKAFKEWFQDTTIGKWFTDQDGNLSSWKLALAAFATWFGGRWVTGVVLGVGRIGLAFAGLLGWPALLIAGFAAAIPVIKSYIDDAAEHFGDVMSKAGEKASLVVAAVHKFNDPNATVEDKIVAAAKVGDGFVAGAGLLSLGTDGVKNMVSNLMTPLLNGSSSATGVEVPHWNKRIFKTDKGDVVREGGSRSWRNNNPGNIEYGDLAKKYGAIGTDGRFAIFPTEEMGNRAKNHLLFESNRAKALSTKGDYGAGLGYKDKTLSQAIRAYAPQEENPTDAYISRVLSSVGGVDKKMGEYTKAEREVLLAAFKSVEGWKVGSENSTNHINAINNTNGFISSLSKPFAAGINGMADNFLGQTNKLQSQTHTVNNKTDINVGDININTSSNSVSGVSGDMVDSIANRVYQLVPTMN